MRWTIPLIAALVVTYAQALAGAGRTHPPAGFFAGSYIVVGKAADNGGVYDGTATIDVVGEEFRLYKRFGGLVTTWPGRFEVPMPPGEGTVLRFRNVKSKIVSTCLWTVDLDNYPRLSCLIPIRERDGPATVPGLEVFYPVSSWPGTAKEIFTFPKP